MMDTFDAVFVAHKEGRHAEAVALLRDQMSQPFDRRALFALMFGWRLLVEDYPPARDALAAVRDEQVRLLSQGEADIAVADDAPQSRFRLIARMNEMLGDARSTYAVFTQLLAHAPDRARRDAFVAMPAVVEAGDFALAERFVPDPLHRLAALNALAAVAPLMPGRQEPPRLAADLSNFMKDVRLRAAALRGLARVTEADALRDAALAGLASPELRALAQRELDAPGAILRHLAEHQAKLDD